MKDDGSFYAQIEAPAQMETLEKYGILMREYLQKEKPEQFQKMIMNGSLWDYLQEINTQCWEKYDRIVREMREDIKPLLETDFLGAVRRSYQIETQADEIVQSEMFKS